MSGKSLGKNKTMSVAQEDLLLTTKHEMLMENYESLKQDYASLEQRLKLVEEMNVMMKPRLQNQNQGFEAANLGLLEDLERERDEKEEYKKMVEEMKWKSEAEISELMIRNEELLIVLEKQEEEQRKRESKFEELAKRFDEIEKECSHLKSLCDDDAKKLKGQGKDNNVALEDDEVFVVLRENHNVNNNINNTVADPIVLSDESDAETDNPTRESNINTPLPVVGIKQEEEEGSNGVNSSQVKHPSSSRVKKHPSSSKVKRPSSYSSSSSSSSDVYVVPLKRSRDDGYNKTF